MGGEDAGDLFILTPVRLLAEGESKPPSLGELAWSALVVNKAPSAVLWTWTESRWTVIRDEVTGMRADGSCDIRGVCFSSCVPSLQSMSVIDLIIQSRRRGGGQGWDDLCVGERCSE